LGAEGIPVAPGIHLLIADDTESFVEAICKLISDKPYAEKLSQNCYDLVKENFSLDRLTQEAARILKQVAQ
ncbi:MAG TPA: hypothetical protein VJ205_00980, partial [Gammaproteobacteria bacterium]|nr:hypothetical protein [Gammaproteobacteria bacterium]